MSQDDQSSSMTSSFETFVADTEPRLRRALAAAYGPLAGREATVDALSWAWEHWPDVQTMANPVGYLFRVGQTAARRSTARVVPIDRSSTVDSTDASRLPEPRLMPAIRGLSEQQRVCVVLVHGYGWTQREAAELLELSPSTVRNHLDRALAHLRRSLEVPNA